MPRTLANRYDTAFWVRKCNEVLSDMEKMGEIPRTKMTDGLILTINKGSYKIPNFMSKVLNIYDNEGTLLPFTREGLWLEIDKTKIVSSTVKASLQYLEPTDGSQLLFQLISGFVPDATKKYFVLAIGGPNKGRCIPVESIVKSTITNFIETRMERSFDYPDTAQNYTIYEHGYYIEYATKFMSVLDATTSIVGDDDIPEVIEAGMRYYGELQTEEEGEFVNRTFQEYSRKIKDWYKRHQREARLTSRYMPRF